jgi:hypothetical protein
LAFYHQTKQFLGINTFGIRMRHGVFDRWLTEERSADYVIEHLKDANFDPEFYSHYEDMIVKKYNIEFGTDIRPNRKSWKRIFSL